jgi:hypothetical protein
MVTVTRRLNARMEVLQSVRLSYIKTKSIYNILVVNVHANGRG